MNAEPLSQELFEAMKLIINTKHVGDIHHEELAKLTYEQYLNVRKILLEAYKSSNTPAVCVVDPSHTVHNHYRDVRYVENARTGEQIELDCSEFEYPECKDCKTDNKVFYACEVEAIEWEVRK